MDEKEGNKTISFWNRYMLMHLMKCIIWQIIMEDRPNSSSALGILRDCEGYGDRLGMVSPWKSPKCRESQGPFMRIMFPNYFELSADSQDLQKSETWDITLHISYYQPYKKKANKLFCRDYLNFYKLWCMHPDRFFKM